MAIDDSCSSKQTFCALGYQTVSSIANLNFSYDGCITSTEVIEEDTWNEIIDEIVNIYNYGSRGTRNPTNPLSITDFTSVTDDASGNETSNSSIITDYDNKKAVTNSHITLDDYNQILSTIGLTTISNTDDKVIIYGNYFENIKNQINNLVLSSDRCNNCNTSCNATCQAISQCCTECCTTCSECGTCQLSNQFCNGCDVSYMDCLSILSCTTIETVYKV